MTERRRSLFILLLVLGLIAGSAVAIATKPTKLGLDLKGGVQLVYQAKPTPQQPKVTQEALGRALDIMRQRVDAFGVSEPELSQLGSNQIQVNLPGVSDAQRAANQVGSTAQLFFYDWEANILDSSCKTNPDTNANGEQPVAGLYKAVQQASKCKPQPDSNNNAAAAPRYYVFDKVSHQALANGQNFDSRSEALKALTPQQRSRATTVQVPTGILVVQAEKPNAKAPAPDAYWVIQDNPALSGTDIKNPKQTTDQQGAPIVTFDFTSKGRQAFQDITRRIAQRGQDNSLPGADVVSNSQHFAIVLDNQLISAPYINYQENPDGIDGSTGAQISGGFTVQTAQDLAKILQIGALPIRLDLISRSQVSASLGQQALNQGLVAGLVGFAVVALFLIAFYRVLGLIATAALAVYALYFYALIKLIPITMTLPGIAGLILTIGVAADANIVVFERVKEEIRAGRGVGQAIVSGYRKGLTAIVDANIVTFLVAFILFVLATAGVKGFAFTLGLGVLVSLFTAVMATQAILYSLRGTRLIRSRAALGAGKQRFTFRWDYMGKARWFFSLSGVILLVGALAISGRGINFGIDFDGGTRLTTGLERPATVNQIRSVLAPQGLGDAKIQTISNDQLGPHAVQITTKQLGKQGIDGAESALDKAFGIRGTPNEEEIGPSFGQSVAKSAIIAIVASLIVISVYIALRFEWKFAVPVLIALMHDVLIVSGVYALVGREVTTSTVAALLTILGYSLYDTIIVFDRVRENIPRMPSAAFSQIVNRSMSEVVTRSLATSFSTLLPVLALLLFGGETLKDFAFALLVGIASGAYSSIFIASPVLTHWKEREPVYRAREERIERELGEVPAYATTAQGGPVDVAPPEPRRARAAATADPAQGVSQREFDEMVANLGIEEAQTARRSEQPATTGSGPARPVGGRRARSRSGGGGAAPRPPREGDDGPGNGTGSRPAGEDGGAKGADAGNRTPRNRRPHGRPR